MKDSPSLYCVVVTYNGSRWIRKCILSILDSCSYAKVIVVDNDSTDDTVDIVQKFSNSVELVRPGGNLGFGKGNNVGIRLAMDRGADYVFLLNQDAYVVNDCLERLMDAFRRNTNAGIISPMHLAGDRRNLDFLFYHYVDPKSTPFFLGERLMASDRLDYSTVFVNAAAWMLSSQTINAVGSFHPIFDHYGEDAEYCYRIRKAGFEVLICAAASIIHDRPQSRAGAHHEFLAKIRRSLLLDLVVQRRNLASVSGQLALAFGKSLVSFRLKRCLACVNAWFYLMRKASELRYYAKTQSQAGS